MAHTESKIETPASSASGTTPRRVDIDDLDTDWSQTLYDGRPFTGVAVETHPDGNVVAETEYRNGVALGRQRAYHPDGQPAREYEVGVWGPEGSAREWYPNGQLKSEAFYENGLRLSVKEWDASGSVTLDWRLPESDPDWTRLMDRRGDPGQSVPPN